MKRAELGLLEVLLGLVVNAGRGGNVSWGAKDSSPSIFGVMFSIFSQADVISSFSRVDI